MPFQPIILFNPFPDSCASLSILTTSFFPFTEQQSFGLPALAGSEAGFYFSSLSLYQDNH